MIKKEDIKVEIPKEEWKTIFGFPDYEISNIARVRNKKTGLIKVPSVGKKRLPCTKHQEGWQELFENFT